jgi:hypothetical protein
MFQAPELKNSFFFGGLLCVLIDDDTVTNLGDDERTDI